jgi:hypothetical protein
MEKSPTQPKKENDPLRSIKHIGYCRAFTPPGENTTIEDMVQMAKHALCRLTNTLWKDPIWDQYTDEEILVEYFAHRFCTNADAKKEFEVEIDAGKDLYGEDIFDWLDRKVKQNQEEMQKKLDEMPDKVSYTPDGLKDIEE